MSPSVQEFVSELLRCYSHGDIQVRRRNGDPSAIFLLSRNIPGTDTQTCAHRHAHTGLRHWKAHLTPRNPTFNSCCKNCINTCCQLGERRDRMRKITAGRQQKKGMKIRGNRLQDFLHRTSFWAQIYLHVSVWPLLVPDSKPTLSLQQRFIHSWNFSSDLTLLFKKTKLKK